MNESVTYQAILEEGRVGVELDTRKEDLLLIGQKRFGPPEERIIETITKINDADRLKRMLERSLDVSTWDELLSIP